MPDTKSVSVRRELESGWRRTTCGALVHLEVGTLEMAGVASGVE